LVLVFDCVMPAFSVNSEADSVVETEIMRTASAGAVTGESLVRSKPTH
jgi:hypothetical protein